jgi:hypothetical protein
MSTTNEFVSTYEAALILGRAPDTIRLWVRRGRLKPAVTTRAGRLFSRAEVQQLALTLHEGPNAGEQPRLPLVGVHATQREGRDE